MSMVKFENKSNARKLLIASLLAGSIVGCGSQGDDGQIFAPPGAGGGPGPAGAAPALGAVQSFGVFGGSAGMTNDGLGTIVTGAGGNTADIGTTAVGTSSITGFHDSAPSDIYTETLN